MRKSSILFSVLLVCLMASPFHTNAEDTEKIEIPRLERLTYDVGTLNVHFNENFSGTTFSVYRIQDEGEFPYYIYSVSWVSDTELTFLLTEGDYRLTAEIPSDVSPEHTTFELLFTIDDPDMDEAQSFDRTQMDVTLFCSDVIEEDTLNMPEQTIENRIIQKSAVFNMMRRNVSVGDIEKDNAVNATDAALILQCAAEAGAGSITSFTSLQVIEADVDKDGNCNAGDAAIVLQYAAEVAAGNFTGEFDNYLQKS